MVGTEPRRRAAGRGPRGLLALVLHAHLPYVRHPEQAHFLEEQWLFEALLDCYLPLLQVLRAAARGPGGARLRLTLSLSPTLLSQWADPLLQGRFLEDLERRLRLCAAETGRGGPGKRRLARRYHRRLLRLRAFYLEVLGGDLIAPWRDLQAQGRIELMTTTATHGYLPLLRSRESAVRAQLRVGREAFLALTGLSPAGLWLPECGYYAGLEREILAAGYRYSLVEAHGLQQGRPRPAWDVYAPVSCAGLALFGRDPFSAREVWSREQGYPGHPCYREYHRDLGFEAEPGRLADFLPPGVAAAPTGLKYYRITGRGIPKVLYDPKAAAAQAIRDAARFLARRQRLSARFPSGPRPPLILAPYDAELFGHWWHEGPLFLAALLRELAAAPDLEMTTPGAYLARYGTAGECAVAASSWGERGYNQTWLRPETGWVQVQLHQAAGIYETLVAEQGHGRGGPHAGRWLRQAARSLLLAQSSDWTFHLGRGGGSAYAQSRLNAQLARFHFLAEALRRGRHPDAQLAALEWMDALFPSLDPAHFGPVHHPPADSRGEA